MKFKLCLLFILSFYLVSCGQMENPEENNEEVPSKTPVQTGKASYYAQSLKGNLTSSGEKFNPEDFTAAHRTLPFGTKVLVTNLANNKSIVVRINDRGPHVKKRIIDLSPAAAKKLGFYKKGVINVEIKVVDDDTPVDGKLVE